MSVPTPSDEIVFKQTKERYEYENKVSDGIDIAATNLVGWSGLILSVLLAGGGILISKGGVVLTKLESTTVAIYRDIIIYLLSCCICWI